jgi:hypothetical protein
MIRAGHRVLDDDWLFWGNLASLLNEVACIPEKTRQSPADWRALSLAQEIAAGYIRMAAGNSTAGGSGPADANDDEAAGTALFRKPTQEEADGND